MLFHYIYESSVCTSLSIYLHIYIYMDISQHAILAYCFSMKTKITMTDSKEKKRLEKGKLVDFRSIRFRLQLWDWIGIPKIQCNDDTPYSKPVVRVQENRPSLSWLCDESPPDHFIQQRNKFGENESLLLRQLWRNSSTKTSIDWTFLSLILKSCLLKSRTDMHSHLSLALTKESHHYTKYEQLIWIVL